MNTDDSKLDTLFRAAREDARSGEMIGRVEFGFETEPVPVSQGTILRDRNLGKLR